MTTIIITPTIKVQIVEAIAQYNAQGTEAIDTAYEIYSENGGTMTAEEFSEKVYGSHNENLHEIDSIDFMYDSESEKWASDEDMATWYDQNIA